jgi:hypothetical protein
MDFRSGTRASFAADQRKGRATENLQRYPSFGSMWIQESIWEEKKLKSPVLGKPRQEVKLYVSFGSENRVICKPAAHL